VFGIIGNVGTPTAAVALPFALKQRMMFFGAFTGANLLRRDPPDRYVFNYRASYAEETDAVVRYLVNVRRLRPEQIVVFAQQDAFGDAGFDGVAKAVRALRSGRDTEVLQLNYKRNTIDVDEAVAQLRKLRTPPRAVVMVATYRAAAKFIEKTRDINPPLIYSNVSFVGSTALAEELMLLGPKYANGVIVTQVVPAVDSYSSVVLEYKTALSQYFPGETPDYVSLEGYITANVMIEGLKRTGPMLDTERLVEGLESLRDLDLGLGTLVNFGRTEHQGIHGCGARSSTRKAATSRSSCSRQADVASTIDMHPTCALLARRRAAALRWNLLGRMTQGSGTNDHAVASAGDASQRARQPRAAGPAPLRRPG
jgi:ABC-type branched-subunit amino acid transport system substrate-binding protein